MKVNKNKIIFGLLITFIISTFIGHYVYKHENRDSITEVHVLRLKNNVAIFVRTPNDKRYLINGGANSEIIRHITKILPFYTRRIDGIFITDTNPNNAGGLISIVDRYEVEKIYVPKDTIYTLGLATSTDDAYKVFMDNIEEKGLEIEKVGAGDVVAFDVEVKAEILFPIQSFEYSKASPPQIIMRIVDSSQNIQRSVFVIGDATKKIQKKLEIQKSDVFVVYNSASGDQLDGETFNMIGPRFVVYSKNFSKKDEKSQTKNINLAKILKNNLFNIKEGNIRISFEKDGIKMSQ